MAVYIYIKLRENSGIIVNKKFKMIFFVYFLVSEDGNVEIFKLSPSMLQFFAKVSPYSTIIHRNTFMYMYRNLPSKRSL